MATVIGPFDLAGAGQSFTITGIPSNTQMVSVTYDQVSFNNTSARVLLRLGTSGGIVTTNYYGSFGFVSSDPNTCTAPPTTTDGISLHQAWHHLVNCHGHIVLAKMSGTIWSAFGGQVAQVMGDLNRHITFVSATVELPGQLDRVQILNTGAATFDGGTLSVLCMV